MNDNKRKKQVHQIYKKQIEYNIGHVPIKVETDKPNYFKPGTTNKSNTINKKVTKKNDN